MAGCERNQSFTPMDEEWVCLHDECAGSSLNHGRERRLKIAVGARCQHLHILQADAYSGYNELYDPSRSQGAITAALCWAHARRQFFELADIAANARRGKNAAAISPVALAAVKRIDALFDIERDINGLSAEERLRVRQEQSAPLLAALEAWLREEHSRLSRSASVAQPIDYMLKRWDQFARTLQYRSSKVLGKKHKKNG